MIRNMCDYCGQDVITQPHLGFNLCQTCLEELHKLIPSRERPDQEVILLIAPNRLKDCVFYCHIHNYCCRGYYFTKSDCTDQTLDQISKLMNSSGFRSLTLSF